MLNNKSELKDVSSEKLGNHLKEQTSFRNSYIINFSVEDHMLRKNWLLYFEGCILKPKEILFGKFITYRDF